MQTFRRLDDFAHLGQSMDSGGREVEMGKVSVKGGTRTGYIYQGHARLR